MQEECSWYREPPSRRTPGSTSNIHSCVYSSVQEGTWAESHSFRYAGKLFERVQGDKVGNIMLQWRELRTSHPEMFRQGVQVWQSPTAYVDGVLWAGSKMRRPASSNHSCVSLTPCRRIGAKQRESEDLCCSKSKRASQQDAPPCCKSPIRRWHSQRKVQRKQNMRDRKGCFCSKLAKRR